MIVGTDTEAGESNPQLLTKRPWDTKKCYFRIYDQPKFNTAIFSVDVLTDILKSLIITRVYAEGLIQLFLFELIIQKILCYELKSAAVGFLINATNLFID
jgi:hypothetical protein